MPSSRSNLPIPHKGYGCQDRFFTDLISTRGLGVRGWPSGKTEMLRSVVVLPE